MKSIVMNLQYRIYDWLFMNGFLREVITHYDNGKIERLYALGFSLRRKWRETKEEK